MKMYSVVSHSDINTILEIKDALGDRCEPYLARLIEQILEKPKRKFQGREIQDDLQLFLKKHELV